MFLRILIQIFIGMSLPHEIFTGLELSRAVVLKFI
jgi:hypothetical protein